MKPSGSAERRRKRAVYHSRGASRDRRATHGANALNSATGSGGTSRQLPEYVVDFNSQSLYDRYNKLLVHPTLQSALS